MVRNQSHAAGHQPEHTGQPCHGFDRPIGLRQEHVCALPQPHARNQSHCAGDRNGAHRDLDIYEDAKPVQIRRRVGMVFQRPNPFPTMSIYDNVASGLKLNGYNNRRVLDEIVERSLKQLGAMGRGQGRPAQEVGSQPLRRTAAAPLHRARSRGRSRSFIDGRAGIGA